jgi:LacI family transcriptional regulator, galactose operon repressor
VPKLRHIALMIEADNSLDRGVAYGVGDYLHDNPHWSLYVDKGDLKWSDFSSWRADGVIAGSGLLAKLPPKQVLNLKVPLVAFGGPDSSYQDTARPAVMSDHVAIGEMAAEYLINQGLTRFAFCGPEEDKGEVWSSQRLEGFGRRLKEAGFNHTVYEPKPGVMEVWGKRQTALGRWLAKQEKPIGIMAFFDERAREIVEACRVADISIPGEVSIIGVDNDEWLCNLSKPMITSVDTGLRRLGYEAAVLLDYMLSGQEVTREPVMIPPARVVERGSTEYLGFTNSAVAEAVKYIRSHACDPITVTDVLDEVGLSMSKAHRDFKVELGRSVHQEIQRVQMDQVKHLLVTTNQSIKQIGYTTGFENTKYMSKLFHKLVGQTPSEYRQAHSLKV